MPSPTHHSTVALRRLQVVSAILLAAFVVVVAIITLWPGPPDPGGQQALKAFLSRAHQRGLLTLITFGGIEFGANVLMFIPIGTFGALALAKMRWLIVPAAIAASAIIEVIQATLMPERFGTPQDVVANGLGALIGYLLACLVVQAVRARTRRCAVGTLLVDPAPRPGPSGTTSSGAGAGAPFRICR